MSLVFFVTGASSGFGLKICLYALQQKHKVIGTVRSRGRASDPTRQIEAAGGKVLELDTTDPACDRVYQEAESIYGRIDVLVNNAGVSWLGAIEDFEEKDWQAQMDVNVFGPMRLVKAALPGLRARRSGTIVNISSSAGIDGLPSCGIYAASKFAIEGWTESLAREVAEHNIQVLLVEPGAFRTNFLGAYVGNSQKLLDQYQLVKETLDMLDRANGKQPGDPVKAARAIVEVVSGTGDAGHLKGKTLRLPLGEDCVARLEAKIKRLTDDLQTARTVAMATGVDE